jgi:hypothetical protein
LSFFRVCTAIKSSVFRQEQSEIIYQPTVRVPVSRVPKVSAERVEALEKKVNDLEEALADLKNQFLSFKQQFE